MKETKTVTPLVAGVITAALMIVYSTALYFLDLMKYSWLSWLGYIIMIVLLIVFINLHGKARKNEISFGGLFGYGFKTTAIIAIILPIFSFIFFLLFPEIKEKIFETMRLGMEEQGKATDEQIEQTISMMRKSFTLFFIVFPIIFYFIVGAIGSLIGAAVTKKKPVNPMNQMNW
jgi:hypothetical protein